MTDVLKELRELREAFQQKAREVFAPELKRLFDKVEGLESISWAQYAPYFNDGDACEFSVNEPDFKLNDGEEETDVGSINWFRKDKKLGNHPSTKEMEDITTLICSPEMEQTLKDMFGDDSKVTYNGNTFEVEDYDHD